MMRLVPVDNAVNVDYLEFARIMKCDEMGERDQPTVLGHVNKHWTNLTICPYFSRNCFFWLEICSNAFLLFIVHYR